MILIALMNDKCSGYLLLYLIYSNLFLNSSIGRSTPLVAEACVDTVCPLDGDVY